MSANQPTQSEKSQQELVDDPSVAELSKRLDELWAKQEVASPLQLSGLHGSRLGKYEIQHAVGCGAFGVVYRARDTQLDRDVALKIPRPEVLVDGDRLSRFQGEATTAALLDHLAIIQIYEAELSGPTPYIASAYCVGPDLGRWLKERKSPVSADEAAEFVANLASAVHYAHQQGVLHRDLKPSNIMLEPLGPNSTSQELTGFQPRLTDFGLAKLVESSLNDTRSSLLIGTPLYMAPEQLTTGTQQVTPATDVYSLGVILFELLTLRTPFSGDSYIEVLDKVRNEKPVPLKEISPTLPTDLQAISEKCLERDPIDRYQSAQEFYEDLNSYLAGDVVRAKNSTWFHQLARWCRRPERLPTAGRYAFMFQSLIILWMLCIVIAGALTPDFPETQLRRTFADVLVISIIVHLPNAILGWLLAQGKQWSYMPSLLFSILLFGVFVRSAMAPVVMFEYNYPTLLSKLNTFTALILGSTGQLLYHMLAIPAWLRSRAAKTK